MSVGDYEYIIGIDEVGRGPLAGPVFAAAVIMPKKFRISKAEIPAPLRDSKKLSFKQREKWFFYLQKHPFIFYALGWCSQAVIDRLNISEAANIAATKAFRKLKFRYFELVKKSRIFLDKGIFLKENFLRAPDFFARTDSLVRADEKIPAVSLASIAAKVTRDRYMNRQHKKYPAYGFRCHKGYGTIRHFAAIKKHGPCRLHRLTFIKKRNNIILS